MRLLGGLHWLVLAERTPGWEWDDVRDTLAREASWLRAFTSEQGVQTNEVQRCWALLPAFLLLGDRPLDLVELGASAGLNLLWDRYGYRYAAGRWGDDGSGVELAGDEHVPVPAGLLSHRPAARKRLGIDLAPVEVRDPEAVRLLECFVWADQHARLERLRRAVEVARRDPPHVVCGDYVELLPDVLAAREPGALTVVFQTASTSYLTRERYDELRRIVDAAEPPLAWISTRRGSEVETDLAVDEGWELELALRPEHGPRLVARLGFHAQWLEWRA